LLKDEHVARVYDVGRLVSGEPYLVMERLEGVELEAFVADRGPLGAELAVDVVLQACQALAEAHAIGLVHRDIKPANLFLSRRPDGRLFVKILDFGISKWLFGSARKRLTEPGGSLGSPWYMSPEQMANAAAVDQRSDVWALGVLLFLMLSGELPFDGDSVPEVCARVLTGTAPSLRSHRPDIDEQLEAVVMRCLEKQPSRRYAGVIELSNDLRRFGPSAGLTFELNHGVREAHHEDCALADTMGVSSMYAPRPRAPRAGRARRIVGAAAVLALVPVVWLSSCRPDTLKVPATWEPTSFRLPWDPVLGREPTHVIDRSDLHQLEPRPLVKISSSELPATDAPDDPAREPRQLSEPSLTSREVDHRRERYERWLRARGLVRPNEVRDVDSREDFSPQPEEPSE
jgi:serine/threonine protein kinase